MSKTKALTIFRKRVAGSVLSKRAYRGERMAKSWARQKDKVNRIKEGIHTKAASARSGVRRARRNYRTQVYAVSGKSLLKGVYGAIVGGSTAGYTVGLHRKQRGE